MRRVGPDVDRDLVVSLLRKHGPVALSVRLSATMLELTTEQLKFEHTWQSDDDWEKFHWAKRFHGCFQDRSFVDQNKVQALGLDFAHAAKQYGQIIITERFLPTYKKTIKPSMVGGVAGGDKYIVQGILFKFATDIDLAGQWLYGGREASVELANKAAGHELKGLSEIFKINHPALHVPLMCLITFRGFRLTAISLLPITADSLCYGTRDGAMHVFDGAEVPEVKTVMSEIGNQLNLKPHLVCERSTNLLKTIVGPADIEIHQDPERPGQFFALDFARLLPPQRLLGGRVFTDLFRAEFLRNYAHPLSSDAFTGFGKPENSWNNAEVEAAFQFLLCTTLPKFSEDLTPNRVATGAELVRQMHDAGLNLRFLARVRQLAPFEATKKLILNEMVTRTFAKLILARLRSRMEKTHFPGTESYLESTRKLLNSFLEPAAWRDPARLKQALLTKYGEEALTDDERQADFDLRESLASFSRLFSRLGEISELRVRREKTEEFTHIPIATLTSPGFMPRRFVSADFFFEPQVRQLDVILSSAGESLFEQALMKEGFERVRLLYSAVRAFERDRTRLTPTRLIRLADALIELAKSKAPCHEELERLELLSYVRRACSAVAESFRLNPSTQAFLLWREILLDYRAVVPGDNGFLQELEVFLTAVAGQPVLDSLCGEQLFRIAAGAVRGGLDRGDLQPAVMRPLSTLFPIPREVALRHLAPIAVSLAKEGSRVGLHYQLSPASLTSLAICLAVPSLSPELKNLDSALFVKKQPKRMFVGDLLGPFSHQLIRQARTFEKAASPEVPDLSFSLTLDGSGSLEQSADAFADKPLASFIYLELAGIVLSRAVTATIASFLMLLDSHVPLKLSLTEAAAIEPDCLLGLAPLQNLAALDLSGCIALTTAHLSPLLPHFPSLTSLNLAGCLQLTDLSPLLLLNRLETLDISQLRCKDHDLRPVLEKHRSLSALVLSQCRNLSADFLPGAVAMLPALVYLDYRGLGEAKALGRHYKRMGNAYLRFMDGWQKWQPPRRALEFLCHSFPGLRHLDLRETKLPDKEFGAICESMLSLEVLLLGSTNFHFNPSYRSDVGRSFSKIANLKRLWHLCINNCTYGTMSPEAFGALTSLTELRRLSCHGFWNPKWQEADVPKVAAVFAALTQLEDLDLGLSGMVDPEFVQAIGSPNLRRLVYASKKRDFSLTGAVRRSHNLSSLSVGPSAGKPVSLRTLATNNPRLSHLDLSNADVGYGVHNDLYDRCRLKHLNYTYSPRLNNKVFEDIQKLTRLRTLVLLSCPRAGSPAGLHHLLPLPALQYLELGECFAVEDRSLVALNRGLPNLQGSATLTPGLGLSKLSVTDSALVPFLRTHPQLHYLDLSNCRNLGNATVIPPSPKIFAISWYLPGLEILRLTEVVFGDAAGLALAANCRLLMDLHLSPSASLAPQTVLAMYRQFPSLIYSDSMAPVCTDAELLAVNPNLIWKTTLHGQGWNVWRSYSSL